MELTVIWSPQLVGSVYGQSANVVLISRPPVGTVLQEPTNWGNISSVPNYQAPCSLTNRSLSPSGQINRVVQNAYKLTAQMSTF